MTITNPDPTHDDGSAKREPDAFWQQWQQEKEAVKQAIPINKEAIFDALAAANIVRVQLRRLGR